MSPHPIRRLGTLVEPLAAAVYFAPEAHQAYAALGCDADFWAPYYCSRGACLGETPAAAVAAAFGVFNPAHMETYLNTGWKAAPPAAFLKARVEGATAQLERLLGPDPEGAERATELLRRMAEAAPLAGRPLFAGLAGQDWPGTKLGDLWHAADLVREHRGDTHTAAWNVAGYTAPEILMVTELWWGLPHGSYLSTRFWDDAAVARGLASLRARGDLEGDPPALSATGLRRRVALETSTDEAEAVVLDALTESERDELFAILAPMAATICAGGGYPADPNTRTLPGVDD